MCGICGVLSFNKGSEDLKQIAKSMATELKHRGPDARNNWSDGSVVAFGHARLAVIDISEAGLQPMSSASRRFTICFNGEIYNYQELRGLIEGRGKTLRGGSDTEALIECIDIFGLNYTLGRAVGMFAFALWDAKEKSLTLCRDRLGEKPLFYGWVGGDLVFASELKAFRRHPDFRPEIDRKALSAFVKYNYVPTPLCIFKHVKKLPAASTVRGSTAEDILEAIPEKYWVCSKAEVAEDVSLEDLLASSVGNQMVSDVPIGCFLSGGIDSSLITAVMQSLSETPISTFTIGFEEVDYNESDHARAVANHLGTVHHEKKFASSDILNIVPEIPHVYDEPFADASQLPTILLARLAREHVTVCLSGDGGDELFCGYQRYSWARDILRVSLNTPKFVKGLLQQSSSSLASLLAGSQRFGRVGVSKNIRRMNGVLEYLDLQTDEQIYDRLISFWREPAELVVGGENVSTVEGYFQDSLSIMENAMLHDIQYYLSDDIMTKVDRATMSVGLESRAPLLDHRIVEYASSLSLSQKVNNGRAKYPLKKILKTYIPDKLIDRPKMGFGVPLEHWFRGELRGWAEDRLDSSLLDKQGFFDSTFIESCWKDHLSGVRNRQYQIWNILVFQEWYNSWVRG